MGLLSTLRMDARRGAISGEVRLAHTVINQGDGP